MRMRRSHVARASFPRSHKPDIKDVISVGWTYENSAGEVTTDGFLEILSFSNFDAPNFGSRNSKAIHIYRP